MNYMKCHDFMFNFVTFYFFRSFCRHLLLSHVSHVLSEVVWPQTQKFWSINQILDHFYFDHVCYNQLFYHQFVCESFEMSSVSINSNDIIHFVDKFDCVLVCFRSLYLPVALHPIVCLFCVYVAHTSMR